jgi:glycosyltransferase involved in cell wall biosynthesis
MSRGGRVRSSGFHLGISGTFLDQPMVGSGQYTRNLLRELLRIHDGAVTVFCPTRSSYIAAEELIATEAKEAEADMVLVGSLLGGAPGKVWFELLGLPGAAAKARVEVLHVPYLGPPLGGAMPVVVTVHDLIPVVVPRHRGSLLTQAYTGLACRGVMRARLVMADSAHTKRDIMDYLKLPPQRIRVIHLAADSRYQPVTDEAELERVRQSYGLDKPFVFYVGGLEWRKNVPALIQAFAEAPEPWRLVIVGEPFHGRGQLFPNLIAEAREVGVVQRVRFLGHVPAEDLPTLHSLAGLFVYPALYEGFGLSPLEAMACGAPVLCSNRTSLPEVVGDAAALFDPGDPDDLPDQLIELLRDQTTRRKLGEQGLARARTFSWRRTARETYAVYRDSLPGKEIA